MDTSSRPPHPSGIAPFAPVLWPIPGLVIAAWFFPTLGELLLYPLALVVPFVIGIFAHEAAHALTARLNGFEVSIFGVWPVTAVRIDGRWRFRPASLMGPSGFVGIEPSTTTPEEFARGFRRMAIAAPLVSVGLVPFGLWAASWGVVSVFRGGDILPMIAGVSFAGSAIAGAICLIPSSAQGMRSDGANYFLLRDASAARTMQDMVRTTSLVFGARRPIEWTREEIEHVLAVTHEPTRDPFHRDHQLAAALFLTCAYIDHQQPEDALRLTTHLVGPVHGFAVTTNATEQALLAYGAYLTATHRCAGLAPKAMLNRIPIGSPTRRTSAFKSAEAMVLAIDGQHDAARRAAKAARKLATRCSKSFAVGLVELDMANAVLALIDAPTPRSAEGMRHIGPAVSRSA